MVAAVNCRMIFMVVWFPVDAFFAGEPPCFHRHDAAFINCRLSSAARRPTGGRRHPPKAVVRARQAGIRAWRATGDAARRASDRVSARRFSATTFASGGHGIMAAHSGESQCPSLA
jgi:hypothetical protein